MELNVLGTPLQTYCMQPATGYFRDGYCETISQDSGTHIVCAVVLEATLQTALEYCSLDVLKHYEAL